MLRTPNLTAGLDHVATTDLPFEVSAENPVAKCLYYLLTRVALFYFLVK